MAGTKHTKSSLALGNWQNLPYHVFGDIMTMTMMGMESLNDLQKCRKVCKSWNVMMSQMTKYGKDTIRKKAESLAYQIRKEWEDLEQRREEWYYLEQRREWEDFEMIREEWEENEEAESKPFPPFPDIATTASLAHHGIFWLCGDGVYGFE